MSRVKTTIVTGPGLEQQRLGIDTASGDPNLTVEDLPHTDTIKTALLFKMESITASDEDRNAARALFAQLYPQENRQ
jgi:hypothetical protein